MSNLKTYLASKYMSGPKADAILAHAGEKKKKRKRPKNEDYVGGSSSKDSGGGLQLRDEDEWRSSRRQDADLDEDDAPVIGSDVATFKKGQSAWATVGSTALPMPVSVKEEVQEPAEEAGPSQPAAGPPKPLTKRRGGLRTAAQMAEEAAKQAAEVKSPSPEPEVDRTKTVHRDQSGRVVDVDQLRQEALREEEAERIKEAERKEWTKGLVQRESREKRERELKAMGEKDVARHADDEAMNRELKEVEHWNDPAANFLKKKKKGPKRPTYKGSYAQNRFGIAPGYRWDGVDRSTGFEKKWLQAQNTTVRREYEAAAYSMEDM